MVGDDPSENDGDPLQDGSDEDNPGAGVLALRAEAFGPGGAHRVIEATVARPDESGGGIAPAGVRMLSMTLPVASIMPAATWGRISRTNRQVWSWRRFPQHCNPVACGALADN